MSFTYARTVAPYAVHVHDGRYYVWGVLEGEPAPKLYALDRMAEVVLEADAFVPDPGLALDDALRHSFGTMVGDGPVQDVVVRFSADAAAFVRCRRWPAQTQMEERGDGTLALTFTVTRSEELVAWTLSFGGAATIESPPAARDALRSAARRVLRACEPAPPSRT